MATGAGVGSMLTVRRSGSIPSTTATDPWRASWRATTCPSGSRRRSSSNAPSPHLVRWIGVLDRPEGVVGDAQYEREVVLLGELHEHLHQRDEVCEVLDDLEAVMQPPRASPEVKTSCNRSRSVPAAKSACSVLTSASISRAAWPSASSDASTSTIRPGKTTPEGRGGGDSVAAAEVAPHRRLADQRGRHRVADSCSIRMAGFVSRVIRSSQSGRPSQLLRDPRRLAVEVAEARPPRSATISPSGTRMRAHRRRSPRRRSGGSGRSPRAGTAGGSRRTDSASAAPEASRSCTIVDRVEDRRGVEEHLEHHVPDRLHVAEVHDRAPTATPQGRRPARSAEQRAAASRARRA